MEQSPKLVHPVIPYERISTEEAVQNPSRQYEQTLENLQRQLNNTQTVLLKLVKDLTTCHPDDEAGLEKGIKHETMCLMGFKSIIREVRQQQAELLRHATECFECRHAGSSETEETEAMPVARNEHYLRMKQAELDMPTIRLHIKEWLAMDMHDFELNLMRNHSTYGLFGHELFELCLDSMDSPTIAQMLTKVAELRNPDLAKLIRSRLQATLNRSQISPA